MRLNPFVLWPQTGLLYHPLMTDVYGASAERQMTGEKQSVWRMACPGATNLTSTVWI
jgi:hypothetical protein